MRITPAGAGKTWGVRAGVRRAWDHPRRCGENLLPLSFLSSFLGSPPQVRGKLEGVVLIGQNFRITPAGAGKTRCTPSHPRKQEDHPRRCGENYRAKLYAVRLRGSPPQVRGKPTVGHYADGKSGITPAGAGKTNFVPNRSPISKDHPRRCGENSIAR